MSVILEVLMPSEIDILKNSHIDLKIIFKKALEIPFLLKMNAYIHIYTHIQHT